MSRLRFRKLRSVIWCKNINLANVLLRKDIDAKKAAGSLLRIRMNFLTIRHCFPSFLRGKIINRIHGKKFGLFSRFRKWYELEEKSVLTPKLKSFFTEDQLIFSISLFVITTRIYHKNPDTLAIPFGLYLQVHSF